MRKFLEYIRIVLIGVPQIIYYHFRYIRKFAKHPEKYEITYRFSIIKKYFNSIIKLFRLDIHSYDLDRYESYKGKKLIISNHFSVLDPLIYIMITNRPVAPVAKKEVMGYPFIGKVLKAMGGFSLDRKNIMNQIGEIKNIVQFLKSDIDSDVLVFAEGTRNKHPESHCLDFHAGTFKVAQMAKVPICYLASFGSFRICEIKHYMKVYPVWIQFGELKNFSEIENMNTQEMADMYKKIIDKRIDEFRALDREYVYSTKLSTKRKALETMCDFTSNS